MGIPIAQTLSVGRIETAIVSKLENRIEKLHTHHLALAASITIANSILLGCIWYMLAVWAGKKAFLTKLQRIIDHFVWAGLSWVNRAT